MTADALTTLDGVALLAARTARSQAYLQTLIARGMRPEQVLLVGDAEDNTGDDRPTGGATEWEGLLLPDLEETLSATCRRAGLDPVRIKDGDINSEAVGQALAAMHPQIVLYSGAGGQIVSDRTLARAPHFLHAHSGWLPEYRGSTTLYYALLNGEPPAVSAILMDSGIDTGTIVARRRYPAPVAGMDIDRRYDPAIRADLLARVLDEHRRSGRFPDGTAQNPGEGSVYYVIHPLLKHLGILSLEKERTHER